MANKALTPQAALIRYLKADKNELGIEKMSIERSTSKVTFRKSFFYRKGKDSCMWGHEINDHLYDKVAQGKVPGVRSILFTSHREDWKRYPGTSYFVASFLIQ